MFEWITKKILEKLANTFGKSAMDPLFDAFKRYKISEYITKKSWMAIGKPAVDPLIKYLSDRSCVVPRIAVCVLGDLGDQKVVDPLIQKLKYALVWYAATFSLAKSGNKSAVEPLSELLSNRDIDVFAKQRATEVLRQIGEPISKLSREETIDVFAFAKRRAAEALGRIGDLIAIQFLILALKNFNKDKKFAEAVWQKEDKYVWHTGDDGFAHACYWAHFNDQWDNYENSIIESLWKILNDYKETAEFLIQQFKKERIGRVATSRALMRIGKPILEPLIRESKTKPLHILIKN